MVSLPMLKPTRPAAVAAPAPADEPLLPSLVSQGVFRRAAMPDIAAGQRAQCQLGDQHRACLLKPLHDGRVIVKHLVFEWHRAPAGGIAARCQQVFRAPWDAMQRTAIQAAGDFVIGAFGLRYGEVFGVGGDALQKQGHSA